MAAKRALIATDVDRTILAQINEENFIFSRGIGHELIRLVDNGFYVAFITGNSMEELTDRLLKFLVEELCHTNQPGLIGNFHFFCNAGGVYFHFEEQSDRIKDLINRSDQQELSKKVMNILTCSSSAKKNSLSVLPEFIDAGYLKKTRMPEDEIEVIKEILNNQADVYFSEINKKRAKLNNIYDLSNENITNITDNSLLKPCVEERPIHYMDNCSPQTAIVQLTLKPILSYQYGKDKEQSKLFENDYRTSLVKKIQSQLDRKGLRHYVVRPGGRSSIDVTFAKLDKAYALEFIIDRLNLQGQERLGQRFGSNTIYFGDEVIVGCGNDYPVTRIPGLLTFAVNRDNTKIPLLSHVFVPSITVQEVGATEIILRILNDIVKKQNPEDNNSRSVLEVFKEELFKERIIKKLNTKTNLRAHNWQTLNALVSLMCREDESAKRWLEILVDELDNIMINLSNRSYQSAYGTSHLDA